MTGAQCNSLFLEAISDFEDPLAYEDLSYPNVVSIFYKNNLVYIKEYLIFCTEKSGIILEAFHYKFRRQKAEQDEPFLCNPLERKLKNKKEKDTKIIITVAF